MKVNFWKWAIAMIMGVATAASCTPEEDPAQDPIFPQDVLTRTVAAGESVQISFQANLDWTVSISGEGSGNMFWIDDADMKSTTVSGKAGDVVINVVFSEEEEFDKNRVCSVKLSMGGEEKEIAVLTRLSLGRTFEAYAGVAGEYDFTNDFGTEKVTEVELVTFTGYTEYAVPVRVVTNYAWNIVLPDWLKAVDKDDEELAGGQAGTTDFKLVANLSADLAEGAEGAVKFIDASNTEEFNEIAVVLPAFGDRVEVSNMSLDEGEPIDFNKDGQLKMASGSYQDVPAVLYVLATEGFVVRAIEWDGTWHAISYADWVETTVGEFDETMGPLQTVDVQLSVSENDGETRTADIFVFPASLAETLVEQICNPNNCEEFNEPFAKYHVGRLVQAGQVPPYLTPLSSEEMMEEVGTSFTLLDPKGDDNVMQWDFNAPVYQKITYTTEYSYEEAKFECSQPYAYVELYEDTDYPMGLFSKKLTEEDDCWITFQPFGEGNSKGVFNMNYLPEEPIHTAAIFYDENDQILAAVLVEFASSISGGDDAPFTVASGSAEIVKLGMESEIAQILSGNFSVSEVYQITTGDKMISVNTTLDIWDGFGIDPMTWGELNGGPLQLSVPTMYFMVNDPSQRTEAIYVFKGEMGVNIAAIYYVYDPAASSGSAPFSFSYPDNVSGATLEQYTGEAVEGLLAEHYGLKAEAIYELKYTTPSPMNAMVNVPSMPAFGAAWGNYDSLPDYWLTYEQMDDKSILVFMDSETPKQDYFLFRASDNMTAEAVLICTYEPAQ